MKSNTEFLRIVNNEPLVLRVSALADFLWDDFIQDARPVVSYLQDAFKITQLSRFGKELFEYLYNGGDVSTVINLDEIESYFRAQQNGLSPEFPKGYKPENALWFHLFSQVCEAPAWPQLVAVSIGDQFNSGNNAVNVLNNISNILYQEATQDELNLSEIEEARQNLQELREQFLKAKADGNLELAAKLRQQGKELGKQIEQIVQAESSKLQPQVNKAVDQAHQAAKDLQEAMSCLAGSEAGAGTKLNDLEEKKELAKKLEKHPELRKLVKRLGALRQAWANRKRARTAQTNYSDIVGAKFSDEVIKAFPAEIALAATEQGRALFALKYSQKTILTKDYEAKSKEIGSGPVIMYVDISGSMQGERELWAKSIAYVVAEECLKQNRAIHIHLFDTRIDQSVYLEKNRKDNDKLLDFVLRWSTGGGTSFCSVIDHTLSKHKDNVGKADVLMITDGNANVTDPFIKRLNAFKEQHGVQWSSFCIGGTAAALKEFSDYVHDVDPTDDTASAELFQNALR